MPDLLKAAQALDAVMEGQDFVSVNWPESVRFRRAVKSATEDAAAADAGEAAAPAGVDAPAPEPPAPEPEAQS